MTRVAIEIGIIPCRNRRWTWEPRISSKADIRYNLHTQAIPCDLPERSRVNGQCFTKVKQWLLWLVFSLCQELLLWPWPWRSLMTVSGHAFWWESYYWCREQENNIMSRRILSCSGEWYHDPSTWGHDTNRFGVMILSSRINGVIYPSQWGHDTILRKIVPWV